MIAIQDPARERYSSKRNTEPCFQSACAMDNFKLALKYAYKPCDPTPMPLRPFKCPPPSMMQTFERTLQSRGNLSFERVMNDTLGYYLFREYLRENGEASIVSFMEETEVYRRLYRSPARRFQSADRICSAYGISMQAN